MDSQTITGHVIEFLESLGGSDSAREIKEAVDNAGVTQTTLDKLVATRDKYNGTFLHWASRKGYDDLFQLAKEKLPSDSWHLLINARDKYGCTVLHWACRFNQKSIVTYICEKVLPSSLAQLVLERNNYEVTCLHWASRYADDGPVHSLFAGIWDKKVKRKLVLARDDQYGATALHWACRYGDHNVVKLLLQKAVDIHVANELVMIKTATTQVSQLSDNSHDDISKEFANLPTTLKGSERLVLPKTNGGSTALHWACIHGHQKAIAQFLKVFSCHSPKFKDMMVAKDEVFGNTALHWVCGRGHSAILRDISSHLQRGKIFEELLSTKSKDGNIPLHWAYGKGHSEVVDIIVNSVSQETLENLHKIQNNKGETCLHWACNTGQAGVVQKSMSKLPHSESVLMISDKEGCTALHAACMNGDRAVVSAIVKNVEPLENVAKKKECTKNWTALHCACDNVDSGVMQELVENLDSQVLHNLLNERDSSKTSAFDLAVTNKQFDAIAAILSCTPTRYEENLQGMDKSNIVDACKRGSDKAVLDILNAADQSDRTGKLLFEFLGATDDDSRTVLHVACARDASEGIGLIKGILRYVQRLYELNNHDNDVRRIVCHTDNMGRSLILECMNHVDNQVVQVVLDAANRYGCAKDLLVLSFLDAFIAGCNDILVCILNNGKGIEDMLFCVDQFEQTAIHHACMNNYDHMRCLKTVLRVAEDRGFLMKLLCHEDVFGKTFLSYIDNANDDIIRLLISKITSSVSPVEACTWFLTKPDIYGKTAIHCTSETRMYLLRHVLTPFYEDLKKVCQSTKAGKPGQHQAQTQQRHYVSQQPREEFRHFEKTAVVTDCDEYQKVVGNCKPCAFELIHLNNYAVCGRDNKNPDLLTVIGDAKCLDLIQHRYIQAYLDVCWKSHISYVFFPYLVLYMASLVSLTVCVITRYTQTTYLDLNSTVEVVIVSDLPQVASYLNEYFLVILASLVLICEILQMIAKGTHYWKTWSNYADLTVCFGSFIVAFYSVYIDYNVGLHHLGIIIMCVAWVNAAWTVSKISFGKFKPVSLLFIKLFKVLKSVVIFLPVIVVFILTMSFGYGSLLHNQKPFRKTWSSIMKTTAMTLGELDFDTIFLPDDALEVPHFYTLSCLFFLIFLAVMNIALLNLLVATAVGDIDELNSQSEVVSFNCIVDLARECHATSALFTRRRTCVCCGKSYKALPVKSP